MAEVACSLVIVRDVSRSGESSCAITEARSALGEMRMLG